MTATSRIPEELRYTKTHEWFRVEGDQAVVGITDHAQAELTDVVFVDLPAVGKEVRAEQAALVVESVKTVSDIYAPFSGTVTEVNSALVSKPELVNQDPYGSGWLFKLRPSEPLGPARGLSASEYRARLTESPA